MRKRILLIAVPLVVVAIAAGVAVAAPSDAEHSRGPRLDKLHAERPIAASDSTADFSVTDAGFQKAATDIQNYVRAVQLSEYLQTLDMQAVVDYVAAREAAEAAAAQAAAQAAQPRSGYATYSNSYPGDFLACVRQRESGGNYGIYNAGGSGAAGAYQFMPGTWNSIAASSGRGDLVGIDPAQASPADQDAMAQALYAQQGAGPWGGGC
jgi:soluble lytic murein transglycosylase-like protein